MWRGLIEIIKKGIERASTNPLCFFPDCEQVGVSPIFFVFRFFRFISMTRRSSNSCLPAESIYILLRASRYSIVELKYPSCKLASSVETDQLSHSSSRDKVVWCAVRCQFADATAYQWHYMHISYFINNLIDRGRLDYPGLNSLLYLIVDALFLFL